MTDLRKSQIKGMVKSTIKLKKFTFENQDMAFNVRKLLYELLIKFDENKNYEL